MPAFEVFDDTGPLRPARWPNSGWAKARSEPLGSIFFDAAERQDLWRRETDFWIGGYFKWDWAFEAIPLTADSASLGFRPARPSTFGIADHFRAYVYHAIAELDEPGEWYADAQTMRVVAWPRSREAGSPLEISVLENLLRLDGTAHVRIENVVFEMARGDSIQVRGGGDIGITGCTIRWVGGRAVSMIDPRDSGVSRSHIYGTGEGGVWLSAGDRKELVGGRLAVTDTTITDYARLGRTYRPAIKIDGVGNRATGNFIADGPHTAILFTGNDHIIELNEITRVDTETSDAGAIYTGRDWTAQGTVIRHNFLHDLKAAQGFETKGVYLDDFASGITVEGNLFLRVEQPVFIGGGRDNHVIDNVFLSSSPGIHIDARGITWAADSIKDHQSELRAAYSAVPTSSPVWSQRYPHVQSIMLDDPALPKRNVARGNLFCDSVPYDVLPEVGLALQQLERSEGSPSPPQGFVLEGLRRAAEVRVQLPEAFRSGPLSALPLSDMDRRERLQGSPPSGPLEGKVDGLPKSVSSARCGVVGRGISE